MYEVTVEDSFAAGKGIFAVTPGAAEITGSEPHKGAGQSGKRGFPLKRSVNFCDLHEMERGDVACAFYSKYRAVVVSVSQMVTSLTDTRPLVSD